MRLVVLKAGEGANAQATNKVVLEYKVTVVRLAGTPKRMTPTESFSIIDETPQISAKDSTIGRRE